MRSSLRYLLYEKRIDGGLVRFEQKLRVTYHLVAVLAVC
jgi:hypothetical protein